MSSKGEKKKIKALNAPKSVHIHRKENTWTVKTKAGAHKKEASVALGIALRNFTDLARNLKEAKMIMLNGDVKVNGRVRKDHQFGVGIFDVISLPKQKAFYRVLVDAKGRIILKEMKKDSEEKLCRVEKKIVTSKGLQITTDDGITIIGTDAKVGDTLKVKFPENKVSEVIPMEVGANIYITKGVHCSEQGKVAEIISGTAKRERLVKVEEKGKEYATTAKNVYVVGKGNVALDELK
ncbi:MAG: 30S ribosomal protein S4e [Candidatus Diapherotrites archaeon]|jgi:small subunit ribosomal protein S4e|uniref:Small ribosomal subunit protein eS4 n=1 Tax=Candidatus Iainarchaeum sp. TaxID=3101447 RepID=A0A8T5GFD9_9ARCH|nr:30S ribosomal protein S4e [Candidatus Diapherotrites archaeon]MBT7241599.1 30S ribosomal protein S4e [Candidatus Diapherotrites archaeon]